MPVPSATLDAARSASRRASTTRAGPVLDLGGVWTKTLHFLEQSVAHWVMRGGALAVMIPAVDARERRSNAPTSSLDALRRGARRTGAAGRQRPGAGELWRNAAARPNGPATAVRDRYEMRAGRRLHRRRQAGVRHLPRPPAAERAFGGTLYQDIQTQRPDALAHRDRAHYERNLHAVKIVPGTRLAGCTPDCRRGAREQHPPPGHQGPGARASSVEARCPDDGMIEAVRRDAARASSPRVQWHPEFHWRGEPTVPSTMHPCCNDFLEAARARRRHSGDTRDDDPYDHAEDSQPRHRRPARRDRRPTTPPASPPRPPRRAPRNRPGAARHWPRSWRWCSAFVPASSPNSTRWPTTLTLEMGKPITPGAQRAERPAAAHRLLPRTDRSRRSATSRSFADAGMREQITHIPLGVVANISAWNYPWFVGCNVIVPALLTGNAVLYKPSEHATLTGLHITRLLHAAGVPADAMQCLVGAGEVGAALLQQRLDGVFFTGSHATGVRIAQRGGAEAAEAAARARRQGPDLCARRCRRRWPPPRAWPMARCTTPARAAARWSASTCTSACTTPSSNTSSPPSRACAVGDPLDDATYIGAITRAPQLAVLQAQVDDALAKGATLQTGGHALPGPGTLVRAHRVQRRRPHAWR